MDPSRPQSSLVDQAAWQELVMRVNRWANENDSHTVMYSSRWSYWRNAFRAGIITEAEFAEGKRRYGQLWDYVGD